MQMKQGDGRRHCNSSSRQSSNNTEGTNSNKRAARQRVSSFSDSEKHVETENCSCPKTEENGAKSDANRDSQTNTRNKFCTRKCTDREADGRGLTQEKSECVSGCDSEIHNKVATKKGSDKGPLAKKTNTSASRVLRRRHHDQQTTATGGACEGAQYDRNNSELRTTWKEHDRIDLKSSQARNSSDETDTDSDDDTNVNEKSVDPGTEELNSSFVPSTSPLNSENDRAAYMKAKNTITTSRLNVVKVHAVHDADIEGHGAASRRDEDHVHKSTPKAKRRLSTGRTTRLERDASKENKPPADDGSQEQDSQVRRVLLSREQGDISRCTESDRDTRNAVELCFSMCAVCMCGT